MRHQFVRSSLAILATALVAFVSVAIGRGQGTPLSATSPKKGGNPEAAKLKSPVADTPESRDAGRRTYQRLCAQCHGREGKGDGGMAAAGGQPADFTDAEWLFGGSPGEIFTVIRDGTSPDMDSYAERVSETEIWNLVHFLRSVAAPAAKP